MTEATDQTQRLHQIFRMSVWAFTLSCVTLSPIAFAQQAVNQKITVLAAGSLRDALKDLGDAFEREAGVGVTTSFGPSGKLRKEIENGRRIDVFASASVEHTEALVSQKLLSHSVVFAYNDLCIVSRPELGVTDANLLDVLKNPTVRLATSTPVSDPMGDYTWQFFHNADRVAPGTFDILSSKALKLSGASTPSAGERPPYIAAFGENRADAYVMYCTNAASTKASLPDLAIVRIPDGLNVRSTYGIGACPSSPDGEKFVRFVLGPVAKDLLRKHGFN